MIGIILFVNDNKDKKVYSGHLLPSNKRPKREKGEKGMQRVRF